MSEEKTALHTATHALVIRGGSYWTQALSISRTDVCVCVCVCVCVWGGGVASQAVLGTMACFSPSDKQSITNYFWHKADDSSNMGVIRLYDAQMQQWLGEDSAHGCGTVPADCCTLPPASVLIGGGWPFVTKATQQSSISNTINPGLTDEFITIDLPSCPLFPLAAPRAPIKLWFAHIRSSTTPAAASGICY